MPTNPMKSETMETAPPPMTVEFKDAFSLGRQSMQMSADIKQLNGGSPFVILEDNGEFSVHDLEKYAKTPSRLRQTATFSDTESFVHYVNDFKDSGTRIFALFGDKGGQFDAVLDYHETPMDPRWCDHVAIYSCPTTPEWDKWMKLNNAFMVQADFSDFVEDQRTAFSDPNAATMLEIARTLEASQTGKFESSINPSNGNKTLVYKDEVNASAGGSARIPIPSVITVRLQPFRRGAVYQLEARLLFRIRDGKVTFQYQLVRAHEIIEIALKEISSKIVDACGIVPYNGVLTA
jgi:uncharacterized protein YfdQ (DUF2303 family)